MQNKYPIWKNLMLIFTIIIGIIYVIPNLYTEYPIVQVSSQSNSPVNPDALVEQVTQLLVKDKVAYTAILPNDTGLEVRFASTDTQLVARDIIKHALGSGYTVALNLAPSTPAWLSAIHAEPMKQGLDLRGGVHFLLEVDIESVIHRRYEGLLKNIGQDLREAGIRYAGIRYITDRGVNIRFRTSEITEQALVQLRDKSPNLLYKKSKDGLDIMASMSPTEINTTRQNTIEQTMSILRNRVNELGVGEAIVQQQGATRVAVDLPGIQDAARAKQILGGTATLQFYLVDQENDAQIAKQTGAVPFIKTANGFKWGFDHKFQFEF